LILLGWYDNIVIFFDIELVERRVLYLERKVLRVRAFWIVRSSAWCEDQPCSSVHKEGREREEKREDMLTKSEDKNCMLYLNII
jgi:hypothetical protein